MTFRTALISLLLIVLTVIGIYFFIFNKLYPIAFVNFNVIAADVMERNLLTANNLAQKYLLIQGEDAQKIKNPESQKEIRRATIEKLIVDSIIYRELASRLSKKEITDIANDKIGKLIKDDEKTNAGIKILYGLGFSEFKEQILLPQAYKEIFQEKMNLDNQKFDQWLINSKKNAQVIILDKNFKWINGQLEIL